MSAEQSIPTVVENILKTLSSDPKALTVHTLVPTVAAIMGEVENNAASFAGQDKKAIVVQVLEGLCKVLPFPENTILPPLVAELVPGLIDLLLKVESKAVNFVEGEYYHWATHTTKAIPPKVSEKTGRPYKLKAQQPDSRDIHFVPDTKTAEKLPATSSLRSKLPGVISQASLGSCASNAASNALRYLLMKEEKHVYQPSRLNIYYQTRVNIEHSPANEDTGVQVRDVCKSLRSYGVADEIFWPYTDQVTPSEGTGWQGPPPQAALNNERLHKNLKFKAVKQDLNTMKACLFEGFPILVGIQVYPSFESDAVAKTGTVPLPGPDEQSIGGHCILLTGYDDTKKLFTLANEWGTDWGDRGYFTLPYDYLLDPNLASDFWCITSFE